ncbi:MAG: hypothetical protein HZA31_04355 [Opitutae bacterium]|nr:hypothetical protein [Opitutae bacterium]
MSNDRPLVEAALELAEVGFDQFLSSDLTKDIPIVGTAIKICTAADNIRNRLYAAKLHAFIRESERIPEDKKNTFRKKITSSPEEFNRLGENLLLLLERMSDVERPAIMATVFLSFLDGHIDQDTLRRLWEAITDAYLDDIKTLLGYPTTVPNNAHLRYLHKTGLTELESGKTFDSVGHLSFKVSDLGYRLIYSYDETKKKYG